MTWYIEILSLLCSAVCAALIIAFLAVHNNTPIDSWHFYFSINTVVSTLGVVFKLTLLVAVSAALAQGKWTWFRKRNAPLSTFKAIDAASYSVFGSFKLLWRMRGQHLVSAGALVIALGLVIDPFLQAIISDHGILTDLDASAQGNVKATIGKSNRFDGGTQCISTWPSNYPQIDTTPDFAIAAALFDGLNAAISHGYQNVSFTCASGNCTWNEYTSLAVRSTCFDISGLLERTTAEDMAEVTTSTTQASSAMRSAMLNSEAAPTQSIVVQTTPQAVGYSEPPLATGLSAFPDASTVTSASATPQGGYTVPTLETDLSVFSDVSTVNSEVASVQSIASQATGAASTATPQLESYGEAPTNVYSDTSTLNSEAAPTQSTASQTTPQAVGYSEAPLLTDLSVFSDVSTVNSRDPNKRAASSDQSSQSPQSPSQSPAMWTDWTLEHLGLTLSNTKQAWRDANTFALLQAAVVADPSLTIHFVDSQTLLAAFTVIRTDNKHSLGSTAWDAANATAMECGLELTLNVYNSSVHNNVLMENIVASASQKIPNSWLPSPDINQSSVDPGNLPVDPGTLESNPIFHQTFLYRDDYALDPTDLQMNTNENFTIPQKTLVSTLGFLTSLIRQDNDNGTVKAVLQQDQSVLYTYGSAVLQPLFRQTNTTATFDAVARGMSNAIRNNGRDPVSGTAQQWVRYYQVRWAFMTLPLSLLIIGVVFFILSVIDAHKARVPSFKANSIATMTHGPEELLRQDLRAKAHNHSLGVAGETVAKLEWFREGLALTAAGDSPTTPMRDEEEPEMSEHQGPSTPQTPGSNNTLANSPNIGRRARRDSADVARLQWS
ncbi:hypothetical protein QM012_004895 [Aureobasidium pullulans]|uniref:Uncharacterized protein n=1 Tax=Aureobasidium pullulans TaxID=5580 RepID=A0ABR0TV82_AURPU